jgi:glycosyltransferase involved in cell wall biosynthesis
MEKISGEKLLAGKNYEKFFKLTRGLSGNYYVISKDPVIIHVARSRNPVSEFRDSYKFLFDRITDRPAYILCTWSWHIEEARHVEVVALLERELLRQYPNLKFFHLGNTSNQVEAFRAHGLDAVFCNQNCLLDERIFRPLPGVEKKYDAVYDARFIEFKRHHLASKIDKLALIYAQNLFTEHDREFFIKTKDMLPGALYFNHSPSGEYRQLGPEDLTRSLNECRVGLCLSAVEGAMYAAGQYLLAGLPIVSTESLGGRDVFFDDAYTVIVESTPDDVRRGVDELIARNISSDFVRRSTIEKMNRHRQEFISLVQSIYDREGVNRNFEAEWESIFVNKMLKPQSHLRTLEQIRKD